MKKQLFLAGSALLALVCANAATVSVQNTTEDEMSAHALFNADGDLLSHLLTNNIRVGTFSGGLDVTAAWGSGDLAALGNGFQQFGQAGSMFFEGGLGGVFQSTFDSAVPSFSGLPVFIWITDSADYLSAGSQHLIFRFNTNFQDSLTSLVRLRLAVSEGDLLVGEYGNYIHDYGLGGSTVPGFNLVGVVPEPATYAAILSAVAGAGIVLLRRRQK